MEGRDRGGRGWRGVRWWRRGTGSVRVEGSERWRGVRGGGEGEGRGERH